jgi:hypothetical protein
LQGLLCLGPKHLWTGFTALFNWKYQWISNLQKYMTPIQENTLKHIFKCGRCFLFFVFSCCWSPKVVFLELWQWLMQRKESLPMQEDSVH